MASYTILSDGSRCWNAPHCKRHFGHTAILQQINELQNQLNETYNYGDSEELHNQIALAQADYDSTDEGLRALLDLEAQGNLDNASGQVRLFLAKSASRGKELADEHENGIIAGPAEPEYTERSLDDVNEMLKRISYDTEQELANRLEGAEKGEEIQIQLQQENSSYGFTYNEYSDEFITIIKEGDLWSRPLLQGTLLFKFKDNPNQTFAINYGQGYAEGNRIKYEFDSLKVAEINREKLTVIKRPDDNWYIKGLNA